MWSLKGQQVMIETPGQPKKHYGIGAVNYHTGETVVLIRRRKRPTYSPWLNPIEMLWRHFRREVTHCEIFENIKALINASHDFFSRYNRAPHLVLSIIGSNVA
jgi:putative transposase